MKVDRRWLWAGGILTIAGGALALGVPLATLITLEAPPVNDDPVMILKRRLAAGEMTLEEYDRLLAATHL